VIFDWGGTLSEYAMVEMEDMWLLAARHLAPDRELELAAQLAAVEMSFWERSAVDHRAWTLTELLAEARAVVGADVTEAVLEEAGVRYLDAWTPHIRHEDDAQKVLEALRERGLRIGLLRTLTGRACSTNASWSAMAWRTSSTPVSTRAR